MSALVDWLSRRAQRSYAAGRGITLGFAPPAADGPARAHAAWSLPRRSLRAKGLIVFVLVLSYSILLGGFVMVQKSILLKKFAQLQEITNTAGELGRFDADVLYVGNAAIASRDPRYTVTEVSEARAHLRAMWNQYASLTASVPEVRLALRRLDAVLGRLAAQAPSSSTGELRAQLVSEHASLTSLGDRLRTRRDALAEQYRLRSDSVAGIALLFGAGGVVTFGVIITLFFTRLTNDLLLLKDHAQRIVKGDRHELIPVSRHDELGELMGAVNRMSRELDERDKQLEIERHKYFHREKMAAIGDLATGIAHEIGNPISAIAGVAQSMQEMQAMAVCPRPDERCQPALILGQTARLAAIAREIADFATPALAEHQLLDLNDLIRSTCRFVRYDRRFRRVHLDMNLNREVPAVSGIGDRLVQVIMNLLINAVDALEGLQDRLPRVGIATSVAGDEVRMAVSDNGCGMSEHTLRRAFEPFFTTKQAGRGTGLGLALCYSIIEEHGGRIELESAPDQGTCVSVMLPLGQRDGHDRPRAS